MVEPRKALWETSFLVFINFSFKGLQDGSGGQSACHPALQPTYNWIQVKAQYTGVHRNPSALHLAEGRIALNLVSQQQQQKLTPQQGWRPVELLSEVTVLWPLHAYCGECVPSSVNQFLNINYTLRVPCINKLVYTHNSLSHTQNLLCGRHKKIRRQLLGIILSGNWTQAFKSGSKRLCWLICL